MSDSKTIEIPIKQVVFDATKYPRQKPDQILIAMLQALVGTDRIPPIEISQNNYLIDGLHRLQAHQLFGAATIKVKITTCDDNDVLWIATERNAIHGKQLSRPEKIALAKRFFQEGREIASLETQLGVHKSQLYEWLRDEIAKRNATEEAEILDLYLRCYTEEEISDKVKIPRQTVNRTIAHFSENGKMGNARPESVQDYNLWEFQVADDDFGEDGYPGRMPGQVIENLLWYYTEPFDLVIDIMAGSGTTLDVSLAMLRRCVCFDLDPSARPHEIKHHDITMGTPDLPNVRAKGQPVRPKLLIFDPPYWKQKRGRYSPEQTNLANLELSDFHTRLYSIIDQTQNYLDPNGYVAFIIGPTRSNGIVHDHMAEVLNRIDLEKWQIIERIIVSYTTQQALAVHLVQAREGKYMLRRYRDLLILQPRGARTK